MPPLPLHGRETNFSTNVHARSCLPTVAAAARGTESLRQQQVISAATKAPDEKSSTRLSHHASCTDSQQLQTAAQASGQPLLVRPTALPSTTTFRSRTVLATQLKHQTFTTTTKTHPSGHTALSPRLLRESYDLGRTKLLRFCCTVGSRNSFDRCPLSDPSWGGSKKIIQNNNLCQCALFITAEIPSHDRCGIWLGQYIHAALDRGQRYVVVCASLIADWPPNQIDSTTAGFTRCVQQLSPRFLAQLSEAILDTCDAQVPIVLAPFFRIFAVVSLSTTAHASHLCFALHLDWRDPNARH